MSFKETITKVLDKDSSLAKKIRMLSQGQGITITSILMAVGMAIIVLVEVLLRGGSGTGSSSNGAASKPPPKDEKGAKV